MTVRISDEALAATILSAEHRHNDEAIGQLLNQHIALGKEINKRANELLKLVDRRDSIHAKILKLSARQDALDMAAIRIGVKL